MDIIVAPLAQVGQVGLGALFAVSLVAAMLGVAGFFLALLTFWRDNHLYRITKRSGPSGAQTAQPHGVIETLKRRKNGVVELVRR